MYRRMPQQQLVQKMTHRQPHGFAEPYNARDVQQLHQGLLAHHQETFVVCYMTICLVRLFVAWTRFIDGSLHICTTEWF